MSVTQTLSAEARAYNPTNFAAPPDGSWVTTNIGEALAGVATPLTWGVWAPAVDRGTRAPFYALGAAPESALAFPERSEDRVCNLFFGRIALRVDYFCEMGDRVPGGGGEAIARDVLGYVPPDYVSQRSYRRYPVFFAKMPLTFARTPGRVRRIHDEERARYPVRVARTPSLDLAGARAQLRDASERFKRIMSLQAAMIAGVSQPVHMAVEKLAESAGVDSAPLMRGHGSHIENELIEHVWALSRERMTMERFLALHGFYGPDSGELSEPSWREDQTPLQKIVDDYRAMADDEDPSLAVARAAAEREAAEAALVESLPRTKRGGAKLVLRLARRNLPLRSNGKVAYMHEFDIARAASRRIGELLAGSGALEDPSDAFYLTPEELEPLPPDAQELVAERRAVREEYRGYELPVHWTGPPEPVPIETQVDEARSSGRIEGLGVSAGVVEGPVRVVTDPADTQMEAGEILVARTTDPSWASVMVLASGLVVDIGGQLSHAAVVARELGVPCVMDTRDGTRVLRTGDVCRVDGRAGTVEILS